MDASRRLIGFSVFAVLVTLASKDARSASPERLEFVDDDCMMMATVVGDRRVKSAAGSKTRVSCTKSTDGFSCRVRFQDPKEGNKGHSAASVELQVVDDGQGILVLRSPPIFMNHVFIYKKESRFIWTVWGLQGTAGAYQKQCTGAVTVDP